ncbi:MAG: transcriptional regulator [Caenispirillum bisanense]|nr:transcriptional regulator [Caenispirillum bisanense]MCA1971253.1 transcriptional regulator [Caenispirillum sp.]
MSSDLICISGAQLRAARALVRWSARELSEKAGVGLATVQRAEAVDGEPPTTVGNQKLMRQALEAAGVEFIEENGGGPGVRLRKA